MTETWKPVKGYEGLYEASSHGRIKSCDKTSRNQYGPYTRPGKILKFGLNGKNLSVVLGRNGKNSLKSVARLVAEAFLENFDPAANVYHIDGDPTNNKPSNLHQRYIPRGTLNPTKGDTCRRGHPVKSGKCPTCDAWAVLINQCIILNIDPDEAIRLLETVDNTKKPAPLGVRAAYKLN